MTSFHRAIIGLMCATGCALAQTPPVATCSATNVNQVAQTVNTGTFYGTGSTWRCTQAPLGTYSWVLVSTLPVVPPTVPIIATQVSPTISPGTCTYAGNAAVIYQYAGNLYGCGSGNAYVNITSGGGGTGTVTSVGLSAPSSIFAISGSPVTVSGTLGLTFATGQTANQVLGTSAVGAVGFESALNAITMGLTTPAAATFTTLNANTLLNLNGASVPLQMNGSAGTTGQVLTSAGAGATPTWSNAGATSFGALTTGTNTAATMTVGTGASLTFSGTGVVNADQINGAAIPTSAVVAATNASNQIIAATGAANTIIGNLTNATAALTANTTAATEGQLPTAWVASQPYVSSALATFGGVLYRNLTGTNTASNPSVDAVNWAAVAGTTATYAANTILGNLTGSTAAAIGNSTAVTEGQLPSTWVSGQAYVVGALATFNQTIYINATGTNTASNPSVDNVNWVQLKGLGTLPSYSIWATQATTAAPTAVQAMTANSLLSYNPAGTAIAWLTNQAVEQQTATAWVSGGSYVVGALSTFGSNIYKNLTGTNLSGANNPSVDTTNWAVLGSGGALMTGSTSGAAGTSGITPLNAAGTQLSPLLGSATWAANTQIADSGTGSVIQNGTATGNVSLYPTTTTGSINIGGNNQTGTIQIGQSASAQQIALLTTGAGGIVIGGSTQSGSITIGQSTVAQNIQIATTSTGSITIGGSGNNTGSITIGQSNGAQTINVGGPSSSGVTTLNLATGAGTSPNFVSIGTTTSTSSLNEYVGTGGFVLTGVAGSNMTIGTGVTTGAISMGAAITSGTMQIGNTSMTNPVRFPGGLNLSTATGPLQLNGSAGTSGYILESAGAGAVPTWNSPTAVQRQLPLAWTASATYAQYSEAIFNSVLYQNITGTNTASDPSVDTTNWTQISAIVQSAFGTVNITAAQTTASNAYSDLTGSAFTLPSAGTYQINFNIFAYEAGVTTATKAQVALTDSANNIQTPCVGYWGGQGGGGISNGNLPIVQTCQITIASATSYKLRWLSTGSISIGTNFSGDPTTNQLTWHKISGFLPVSASVSFSGILSGTNTSAAMLVGTGSSLGVTGTGTITATALDGSAGSTVNIADSVTTGQLNLANNLTTGAIQIGSAAQTGPILIGDSAFAQTITLDGGTGASTVNIANAQTGGAVSEGGSMTTGTLSYGGTAQTGTITLGQSSAAQTINIGSGTGNTTLNLDTGSTGGQVNIGTSLTSGGGGSITIGSNTTPVKVTSLNSAPGIVTNTATGVLQTSPTVPIAYLPGAQATFVTGATTGTITHNFGSTIYIVQCVSATNQVVQPTTLTINTNSAVLTFSPALVGNTNCVAVP